MLSLRLLLVCGWLLLLVPPRDVAAEPLGCTLARAPWIGRYLMYTKDLKVRIDNDTITLRICAPNTESFRASQMLAQLGEALEKLHKRAGLQLGGAHERTIVLEETAKLHDLGVDGFLSATGIIYLHPLSETWTLVHEAAHYWSNENSFAELWMIEGYAEYLTSLVVAEMGQTRTLDIPAQICTGLPLQHWDYDPPGTARCGYDVGAAIFQDLEQAIGREQLRVTMRRLDEQTAHATSWDLLRVLNRANNRDLTPLLKDRVFPPLEHAQLDQWSRLWEQLRDATELAAPLGITLPPSIGDQIDRFEFDTTAATLDAALKLLNAANSVNERCHTEQLQCILPWQSLPADPQQWAATTDYLSRAYHMLQRYTELRESAGEVAIDLPPPLVQAVAGLQLEAAPRIAQALNLVNGLPALEQLCRQTDTPCRDYWLGAWLAGDFSRAGATIGWLSDLMPNAALVEQRCGAAVLACRNAWKANLEAGSPAPSQSLEQLTVSLEHLGALQERCAGVGWDCRRGWQSALEGGGISGASTFIAQAQQQIPRIAAITTALAPAQPASFSLRSLLPESAATSAGDLRAAQQAFEQGNVAQSLALAEAVLRSRQQARERQASAVSLMLLGGGVLVCLLVVLVLARSLRNIRRSAP